MKEGEKGRQWKACGMAALGTMVVLLGDGHEIDKEAKRRGEKG